MNTPRTVTRSKVSKGFTLIELMIGIAIIGVLSAIAIPAFQDYLNRSKVTELMNIAQSCKAGIIEFTATTNQLLVGANGRIQVTFQANTVAAGIAANNFIALIPFTGGVRHTNALQPVGEWRCVTNVAAEFRRYLPAACRNNNVN